MNTRHQARYRSLQSQSQVISLTFISFPTREQISTSFYSTSFVPQIIRFDIPLFQVGTSFSPHHRRFTVSSLLPSDYKELNVQAQEATRKAIADGIQLIEIQFPAVKEIATAALNQIMDANRSFAREFVRSFVPRYPSNGIKLCFPDKGEAQLATKFYGECPFRISSIDQGGQKDMDALILVLNPGFNVSEYIDLEKLDVGAPVVCINGDLDKTRDGYYPRFFYPKLYEVKTRFIKRFEPIYYLKSVAGTGGWILRNYPGEWQVIGSDADGTPCVIYSSPERFDFEVAREALQKHNASIRNKK